MDQPERYPSLSITKGGADHANRILLRRQNRHPRIHRPSCAYFGLLKLVTLTPVQRLAVFSAKGSLEEGKDADLLILGADLKIETVLARGRPMIHQGGVPVKGTFKD
jgi:cytosine/adenosine deaminase-related metal-dependent hydrolase